MRKDTSFGENKLTRSEFSAKYWLNGERPYQYHTAEIEDGRDEREQFLIANCRAVMEQLAKYIRYAESKPDAYAAIEQTKALRKEVKRLKQKTRWFERNQLQQDLDLCALKHSHKPATFISVLALAIAFAALLIQVLR